jgi:MoaA/NifB/PqqE/SkfB family radical SAM enzyme
MTINLKRLEFTLTTKCNSQCIYCQADASPSRKEVMAVKDACNYLTEACAVSNLESFMVFGGEPMLYPERAMAIFKKARQLKIPRVEMLTNGVWGKDKAEIENLARRLKAAGLNTLGISVDAFHIRYIPLNYPRNAAEASLKAGVESVTWNVAVVESLDAMNEYDAKTNQVLKRLQPVGIEARIHKVACVGRAVQMLREYFQHTSLDGPCEGEPPIGNMLVSPESVCIEPSGSVDICWHLPLGNAKVSPLSHIISEYDWRKNAITKILVREGPVGLLKLAKVHRYRFRKSDYVAKCDLCIEARKTLKPHYPEAYS